MGVKDLWTILTPYCERKPIYELKNRTVAVDLAGWICESLNVVDYFVHPRQYLKNLFFRTCYLLLEGVIPVFVLEGTAPKLKNQVISKRNELQFRGARPRIATAPRDATKGRTRFNYVLKQCENLLQSMGLQCVKAPGEAEAFCAFLNKNGLVDGVISQDSDCFAYGAITVYRNFSVSTQGNSNAQGGAVDVYDMRKIKKCMDFGQNKIIVMALLCGCDYCPEGVGGIGRDSVIKLFGRYKENEILERLQSWRGIDNSYTASELKANDKNVCSNCGHMGKTQSHTKNGCNICRTIKGCNEALWKEERLAIKAELALRTKALSQPNFPFKDVIDEFLSEPNEVPTLNLKWNQPNLVKFVNLFGKLLQWTEIYSFQKFFPLLTRWHVINYKRILPSSEHISPKFITKKRTVKGKPSYEMVWNDRKQFFDGLIPDDQLQTYLNENPKGLELLWSTIEPIEFVEKAYPEIVEMFLKSKQKKPKPTAKSKRNRKNINAIEPKTDSLQDLSAILDATEEIERNVKNTNAKTQLSFKSIDKYLLRKNSTPLLKKVLLSKDCSTPKNYTSISNLESDNEDSFNFSDIIEGITSKPGPLQMYKAKRLEYERIDTSGHLNRSKDDLALLHIKRNISTISPIKSSKKICLSNSVEFMESSITRQRTFSNSDFQIITGGEFESPMHEKFSSYTNNKYSQPVADQQNNHNVSYFFTNICDDFDEFEKSVDISFLKNSD